MTGNAGSQCVPNWMNLREENNIFILKAGCSAGQKTMKVSVDNR